MHFVYSPGSVHLDAVTHVSIIGSVVRHLKLPAVLKYISWLKSLFLHGVTDKMNIEEMDLDVARRCENMHACIVLFRFGRNVWFCSG